ncbi:ATP-binding protein, partial [Lentzea aerocolonigenes]
ELATGAIGAVVLVDTRRLDSSFPSIDFFEHRGIPFVVAVNCFDGAQPYTVDEVRHALDLDDAIPVMLCDARDRESSKAVLVGLIQHSMNRLEAAV